LQIDSSGLIPVASDPPAVPMAAEQMLCAAVRRARSVAPELDLSAYLFAGTPSRILLRQSRRAALLVLGGRRRGGMHRFFTASIAGRVSAAARCPVVVVGVRREVPSRSTPPRVVVGVDATASCGAAVGFAFRAAAQRGIPLVALQAWHGDAPARFASANCSLGAARARAARELDCALERWREEFTDVPVLTRLVHADPIPALVAESVGAALVVVGSRGRGAVMPGWRRSVSRSVLRRAHSAIAVVRPDGSGANSAASGHRRRRSASARGDADSAAA
jgi:nucleotide-binding universal stress UspA family protein